MKQQRMLNRFLTFVLIAALGAAGYSCSLGGNSGDSEDVNNGENNVSPNIQLSGAIAGGGSGYTVALSGYRAFYAKALSVLGLGSPAYAGAGDLQVNKLVAIPMERGSLCAWSMRNSIAGDISNDGAFSLTLPKANDWLLVLIDSNATGTNRFVGSVAMNTASSDSLLNLPATDASVGALDIGTVSRPTLTTNDAISSATVTAANFNMTAAQLAAMAKNDDLFRNAMNIVNNYGTFAGPDIWYQLRPDFHWLGSYPTLTASYTSPDMTYSGMNFQLDTNSTNVTMDDICNGSKIVELYPPQLVTTGTGTFDSSNPISSTGVKCQLWNGGPARETTTSSGIYASDAYEGKVTYSVLPTFTSGAIPAGFWVWKEAGATRAGFEVGNVNPPVTTLGKPKGFVPSFHVNVDGTNKILSVNIRWFYYNETTDSYDGPLNLEDMKILKHFINSAEVKFDVTYEGNRKTCEMYFDPAITSRVVPSTFLKDNCTESWYMGNSAYPATDTGLMGFYETGGFGYFFDFFKPM